MEDEDEDEDEGYHAPAARDQVKSERLNDLVLPALLEELMRSSQRRALLDGCGAAWLSDSEATDDSSPG